MVRNRAVQNLSMVLSIGIVYWQASMLGDSSCGYLLCFYGYGVPRTAGAPFEISSQPHSVSNHPVQNIRNHGIGIYIFLNIVLYLLWNTFNHREFYQVDPLNCHLSAVSRDTRPHDNQRSIERLCIEHILYESHKSRLNHDLPLKLILEIGVANIRIFGSQKNRWEIIRAGSSIKII